MDNELGKKKQHSRFGIASFLLHLSFWGGYLLERALYVYEGFPRQGAETTFSLSFIFYHVTLIAGIVLGIVSVFESKKRNRRNLFGIVGLLASTLILGGFYLILWSLCWGVSDCSLF
ncbi:MAG: hypothetical protein ACXADH_04725 [Candidatus Kariarchaeaceae archaeon]|jgi:uncharacterized membrane protein YozB (DUF420 family)